MDSEGERRLQCVLAFLLYFFLSLRLGLIRTRIQNDDTLPTSYYAYSQQLMFYRYRPLPLIFWQIIHLDL